MAAAQLLALAAAAAQHIRNRQSEPWVDEVRRTMTTNSSVDPCEDFFEYSCGQWLARNPIPASDVKVSRVYQGGEVQMNNRLVLKDILNDASSTDAPLAKAFWNKCLDTAAADAAGAEPLAHLLQLIAGLPDGTLVNSQPGLSDVLVSLQSAGVPCLFEVTAADDLADAGKLLLQIAQAGPALSRAYYVDSNVGPEGLMRNYTKHAVTILGLLGHNESVATAGASAAIEFEHTLAVKFVPNSTGDFIKSNVSYNPIAPARLDEVYAGPIDWDTLIAGMGWEHNSTALVNVVHPTYFKALQGVLRDTAGSQLKWYLAWITAHSLTPYLSSAFTDAYFEFFQKFLKGQQTQDSRADYCLNMLSTLPCSAADIQEQCMSPLLGRELGRSFVSRAFNGTAKARLTAVFEGIQAAFINDTAGLEWLDAPTRRYAAAKASATGHQLGYPDAWPREDIVVAPPSASSLASGSFAHTASLLGRFQRRTVMGLAARRSDVDPNRWELIANWWSISPYWWDAFNPESPNMLIIPAGLTQPPIYYPVDSFPPSLRFGGVATMVGHEFTHGFDTIGKNFDAAGRLRNWWDNDTAKAFAQKAECLVDQYSKYEPLPGLHINGQFTLNENIADNGGMRLAWAAYRNIVPAASGAQPSGVVDGLSNDQLFFLAYGQFWCFKETDDYARFWVHNNPHSLPRFRPRGVLSNTPEFADAFKCKMGAKYNPKTKCRVW